MTGLPGRTLRALALVPLMLVVAGSAQAAGWIEGRWKGAYECAQGVTRLTLTISRDAQGTLNAGFQFWVGDVYGSYRMRGAFSEAGELKLNPTIWITRPEGYEMVGLAGQAENRSAEGKPDLLVGDVTERGCGRFALERQ